MNEYYPNTCSKFYFNGELIETRRTYIEVIPTPEQIQSIKSTFENKSPHPYETFLNRYLLHINEDFDKTTGQHFVEYSFVLFLIGKVFHEENIDTPNILSNTYLTATYYPVEHLDINPRDYIYSPLPIRLTNEQNILCGPDNIRFAENNLISPNSLQYSKVRTGYVKFHDAFPQGENNLLL